MTTITLKVAIATLAIGATSCRDRDIDYGRNDGQARTIVSYPVGQQQEGTVVPWAPPSAFEIDAMAKLERMVPPDVYKTLVRMREPNVIGMTVGLDPEAEKLYRSIQEDRIRVLRASRAKGVSIERSSRRRKPEVKPPAL